MKDHTKIVCVLDRSGSMKSIADDAEGGFNAFLQEQKELGANADITVVLFDDQYEVLYDSKPINEAPELSLRPRGTTALYDAVGKAINSTGIQLSEMNEADRPNKVLFVILTDGQENSSVEFTKEKVLSMVNHQRDKYQWEFIYLAASEAGLSDGAKIGMQAAQSAQFKADAGGTRAAFNAVSLSARKYRSGSAASLDI